MINAYFIKRVFILFSLISLPLLSQNCSQLEFGSGENEEASKTGHNHNDNERGCGPDEDQDGDHDDRWMGRFCQEQEISPVFTNGLAPDRSLIGQRGNITIDSSRNLVVDDFVGRLNAGTAVTSKVNNLRGSLVLASELMDSLTNVRGRVDVRADQAKKIEDVRGPFRGAIEVIDFLTNYRGALCLSTRTVNELSNIRGPIKVFGGTGAEIKIIRDTRGPIFLQNVHLQRLENHRGPIFLKNSTIDQKIDVIGRVINF